MASGSCDPGLHCWPSPDTRLLAGPRGKAAEFAEAIHPFHSTDNRRAAQDSEAFLSNLDTPEDIAGKKIGATGCCTSGAISLTAAAASLHGGNLATDSELGPHLLAPWMKGHIYVAGADQDNFYPLAMSERPETALSESGVDHRCEIFPGALHGWTMRTSLPKTNRPPTGTGANYESCSPASLDRSAAARFGSGHLPGSPRFEQHHLITPDAAGAVASWWQADADSPQVSIAMTGRDGSSTRAATSTARRSPSAVRHWHSPQRRGCKPEVSHRTDPAVA